MSIKKKTHKHFIYSCLFNDISVEEKLQNCIFEDQRQLYTEQFKSKPKKGFKRFLLFYSKEMCIYAIAPKEIKNSSDAVAFRSFNVVDCSWKHLVGDKSDKIYITDKEVSQVFDRFFISHGAMNDLCHAISTKLTSFYSEANQEDNQQFHRMILKTQNEIKEATQAVRKMELNFELPYNQWLYVLLKEKLKDFGFAIFTKDKRCRKASVPISEYIDCKSDLLVYHEQFVEQESIQALRVQVSQMTLESNDEDVVQSFTNIKAGMAELKVNNLDVKAENECIFNMFGEATKLTENVLSTGKIVRSVCIYGILVNAHQHQESLLLKLKMNYFEQNCTFERSRQSKPFVMVLNQVLSILEQ